jgi:hypothetical protein
MTRNLHPTPITDKNGKQTTVHKKAQPLPTAAESSIPAPSLPVKKDLIEVRQSAEARVTELYDKHHDSSVDYSSYLHREIQQYSERILNSIDLATRNDDDLSRGVVEEIVNGEDHALINAAIHYYRESGSTDYFRTALDVRALVTYSPLQKHRDLGDVDEHTQKQCLALMRFSHLIDTLPASPSPFLAYVPYDSFEMRLIKDESLIELIANRPDDVEMIAGIVLQYGTTNSAVISGVMAGMHPAVAEGYL